MAELREELFLRREIASGFSEEVRLMLPLDDEQEFTQKTMLGKAFCAEMYEMV